MQISAARILFFFVFVMAVSCNSQNDKQAGGNATDSSEIPDDSLQTSLAYKNCYENFFRELPRFKDSGSAFLTLEDGSRKSITQFFKDEFMSPMSQYGRKDLDGDGSTELVIYNNTAGAHCCDEYYIFEQKNENEYQFKDHILGGTACVDAVTNTFSFSLGETLGYFFTCYACGFQDSTGEFKTMREIQLKYSKGKLAVVPYDSEGEKQNLENLVVLKRHGFENLNGQMDNGWRKEFGMNIAIWHYNHNKDWKQTKLLFDKYYTFKDAARIWKELYKTLQDAAEENTF